MFRKVFISYAKEDYRHAAELYDHLKLQLYDPWLDKKSLLAGANWELEIRRALKDSDFIILILSSTSVSKRGYIQKEYKMALEHWEKRLEDDIYIIPVLIDECQVPESLSRFHWVRYDQSAHASIVRSLDTQRHLLTRAAAATISNKQLELSKRVHDVVANGLYRVMKEVAHQDTVDPGPLLDKIENLYHQSRDISYQNTDSEIDFPNG